VTVIFRNVWFVLNLSRVNDKVVIIFQLLPEMIIIIEDCSTFRFCGNNKPEKINYQKSRMPPRRTRSKERDRKRKARENMSEEQLAKKRERAREDMKKIRNEKPKEGKQQRLRMTTNRSRSQERDRKTKAREKRSAAQLESERLKAREGMKEFRNKKREEHEGGQAKESRKETEAEWRINWKRMCAKNAAQSKENKKRKREQQNDKEKRKDNLKLQERMQNLRAKKTDEDKFEELRKAKERMRELRVKKTDEEKDEELEDAGERMRKLRVDEPKEQKDYKLIAQKHRRREARRQMSGKERLTQKLKAKKGMNMLKEEGRIHNFERRGYKNRDELSDWKEYVQKGKSYSEMIQHHNPDIVERLNQKLREQKENERKGIEKASKGEWHYNGESGESFWTGRKEPDYQENFCYSPPTKEEKKLAKEAEEKEMQDYFENKKKTLKEKRKQKQAERKEAMAIPVAPIPEKELCAYEKIRDDIIKEREAAMAKCNFFEDLDQLKKDVGLETKDKNEALRKNKKKPTKKIEQLKLNQKREKLEQEMLKFEGSEKKIEEIEREEGFEGTEKEVEDNLKGVKVTEKEVEEAEK
jgi:hypothetical protein